MISIRSSSDRHTDGCAKPRGLTRYTSSSPWDRTKRRHVRVKQTIFGWHTRPANGRLGLGRDFGRLRPHYIHPLVHIHRNTTRERPFLRLRQLSSHKRHERDLWQAAATQQLQRKETRGTRGQGSAAWLQIVLRCSAAWVEMGPSR